MGRLIFNPRTGQFEEQYPIPIPPSTIQPSEPTPSQPEPSPPPSGSTWKPVTTADVEKRKAEEEAYREAKREAREPEPVEAPPLTPLEQSLVAHGKYDIAKHLYEKRTGISLKDTGIPSKVYPSGITVRYLGMEEKPDLGFDVPPSEPITPIGVTHISDIEIQRSLEPKSRVPYKPVVDVERQAGREAGLTTPTVVFEKSQAIRQQQQKEWEAWAAHQRELGRYPHARDISRAIATGLHFVSPEYLLAPPEEREEIVKSWEYGVWRAGYKPYGEEDMFARFTTGFWTAAPTQYVLIPLVTMSGLGAGMGVLSAAYPTAGKIAQYGLGAYMGYETGSKLLASKDPGKELLRIGLMLPFAVVGYRKGFRFGYGRTEQYLYKIHTYKPGTSEYIRFEQAMKVGRLLAKVSPVKRKALDFAKDIMRMDPKTAKAFMDYYAAHKGVIGGSAAGYTQIVGARQPRDIDYFMQRVLLGTEKKVALAKSILPTKTRTGRHLIDIHGKEMYYPGRYHRFGFISQRPVRIGGYKYFTAGEQLFRKGIASVLKETEYRHGVFPGQKGMQKDIFDFVVTAKSQILSLRQSWKPLSSWKAARAESALELFLHPERSVGYGKTQFGIISRFFKATTKPVEPKIVYTPLGYEYAYPSSAYPFYPTAVGISSYMPTEQLEYKPPVVQPKYKPTVKYEPKSFVYQLPSLISKYIPLKDIKYKPSVKIQDYKPTGKPIETISDYPKLDSESPYVPTGYPSSYVPSYYPSGYPPLVPTHKIRAVDERKRAIVDEKQGYKVVIKDRYIEHGKKVRPERSITIKQPPLSKQDALGVMGTIIDQSASMQGRITPTSGKPQKPTIEFTSWFLLQHKFKKRGDVYIEKRTHAIDTSGEQQEITAQGLMTEKRKKSIVTQKTTRKPPLTRRKTPKVSKSTTEPYIDVGKIMDNAKKQFMRVGGIKI